METQELIKTFTETILDQQKTIESLRGEVLILAQSVRDIEGRNEKHLDTLNTRLEALIASINNQNIRSEVQDASHTEQIKSMQLQLSSALTSMGRQYDLQSQAIAEFTLQLDSIRKQCDSNSETLL